MQKQKPLLHFGSRCTVSQKDRAAWADCVRHRWSACVGAGCRAWQGWLCLPRRSPGLCHPAGARLAAKLLWHTAWYCPLLLCQRVHSIVTIEPEINYSSQNKVVLKELKSYNLQRPSIGIPLDEIDSENVWNYYKWVPHRELTHVTLPQK